MAVKYHFANSREPLKEGSDIEALCDVVVPKARFVAMLDGDYPGEIAFASNCRKCNKAELTERFVYVICNGQEVIDEMR